MGLQLVKCISTIDEFNPIKFRQLGIGVEIQDFTEPNLDYEKIRDIVDGYKRLLKDFPYIKAIHGPFLDLKPASPDMDIRRVSYNKYFNTLKIAQELDVDYVLFHSQINPWLDEPYIKALNNSQNKLFWQDILENFVDFKGTILIENVFEPDPMLLREYIETIDLPNVKICLDMGHAKLRTNKPLNRWVEVLREYVAYIHLHWNEGLYDEHSKPEDENIKYIKDLLKKHYISPIVALEYDIDCLEKEIERLNSIFKY